METDKKINIKAILIGVVFDILGSLFVSVIIAINTSFIIIFQGRPYEDAIALSGNIGFNILSLLIGTIVSILAGYIVAWISKYQEVKHAVYAGIIVSILGSLMSIREITLIPLWYSISSIILVVPAYMLGGYIRERVNKKM